MRNAHHLNRPYAHRGARPSGGRDNPASHAGTTPRKLDHHWRTASSRKTAPRGQRPMTAAAIAARKEFAW